MTCCSWALTLRIGCILFVESGGDFYILAEKLQETSPLVPNSRVFTKTRETNAIHIDKQCRLWQPSWHTSWWSVQGEQVLCLL